MQSVRNASNNRNSPRPSMTMITLALSMTILSSTITTNAFVLSTHTTAVRSARQMTLYAITDENAFSDPPIGDDDDCGDECDIDWSAMPSWEDDDEDEDDELEAVYYDDDDEEDDLLGVSPSFPEKKWPSVEQRRLHMEMQWQLEEATQECVVEKPETCGSQECADCHGRGWSNCRFCHGTGVLKLDKAASWTSEPTTTMAGAVASSALSARTAAQKRFILPSTFTACKICSQGVETCRTCQGSGWVASWTQIPNQPRNDGNNDDPLLP